MDEGVLREWLVNIGQRDAYARIAHLLAELWLRLSAAGRVSGQSFRLPLTHTDLGDTLGLTSVHVNRTIKRMRSEGLIGWDIGHLQIPDAKQLMRASDFDAGYLHLERRNAWPFASCASCSHFQTRKTAWGFAAGLTRTCHLPAGG